MTHTNRYANIIVADDSQTYMTSCTHVGVEGGQSTLKIESFK